MQSRVSMTFDVLAVHEIPSTEPATVPFDPTAVNLDPHQTMPHHDGSLQGGGYRRGLIGPIDPIWRCSRAPPSGGVSMSRAKSRAQDRQGTAIVPADSPVFAPCTR